MIFYMNQELFTILVEIEEGSAKPVFVPVLAKKYGENFFEIVQQGRKDLDSLRFKEGEFVYCLKAEFENRNELSFVAYCSMSKHAVLYMTGEQK
jgi:hypothetical protein